MPNSAKNIMGSGMPALTAQAVSGVLTDSQTATGSTQATAYSIGGSDVVVFTTVAASTGAVLPSAATPTYVTPGDEVMITNLGASTLSVYPPVGGQINNVAVNGAFSIATTKSALFVARNGGLNWVAMLGA